METLREKSTQESTKLGYFSPFLKAHYPGCAVRWPRILVAYNKNRSQTRFLPKRDSVENHSNSLAIQGLKLIAASEDKYKPVIQSENRRRWRNLVRVCRIPLDTMLRICLCWVQDPQRKRGRLHGDRAKNKRWSRISRITMVNIHLILSLSSRVIDSKVNH
ncbi:hypothetical protein CHS0354_039696 [Potamilus streckersoni]|uniref:Uncharacterized protein n=1 Tax=Potamilus streckersoni TaxID=2493646 RepID=A0AAE0VUJ9_9BIVA|nr:hypothetical protein CHS0354_039696 [Potamilus streckersoni]